MLKTIISIMTSVLFYMKFTYHEKSHVFNHLALSHCFFVHGVPYANGLKWLKFAIATNSNNAATPNRYRVRNVDVKTSKTTQRRRMAKYKAGR